MSVVAGQKMTIARVRRARALFKEGAAGDIFYRAATQLIALAREGKSDLDLAESIGVLLETWNRQFYRFRKGYTQRDTAAIRQLLAKHRASLDSFRNRRLDRLTGSDEDKIRRVFYDFEMALGPVGAAKALHLLAPRFFPLWDDKIAKAAYRINFRRKGENGPKYLHLMEMTLDQIERIRGWTTFENPIKAIDEYNYCLHTKGWV